jgi:sugar/nucleoside kinase (ribokinase family)
MPYREGFALAGAWLIENEKIVAQYPAEGGSARILEERRRVGGEAYSLASQLRGRAADLPLYALGCVGEDDDGHAVLSACHQLEVDTYQLQAIAGAATAHAEVVISNDNFSRTRFYLAGANDALGIEHFDFRHCLARWFHLGEVHLLAQMSQHDEEAGMIAGRVLQSARSAGLITSLSLAMPAEGFYGENCLKVIAQTDYLILQAGALPAVTRLPLHRDPLSPRASWEVIARDLLAQGEISGVMVYSAEESLCVRRDRQSLRHDFSGTAPQSNVPAPGQSRSAPAFLAAFLYDLYSA